MSLYHLQKFLYHLNRDPGVQQRHADDLDALLDEYELTDEERTAIRDGDVGKIYCARRERPAADALRGAARQAVGRLHRGDARGRAAKYGPVRAGHLCDDRPRSTRRSRGVCAMQRRHLIGPRRSVPARRDRRAGTGAQGPYRLSRRLVA
jgi:hypothetical protein